MPSHKLHYIEIKENHRDEPDMNTYHTQPLASRERGAAAQRAQRGGSNA